MYKRQFRFFFSIFPDLETEACVAVVEEHPVLSTADFALVPALELIDVKTGQYNKRSL